jgi:hypothetical protein
MDASDDPIAVKELHHILALVNEWLKFAEAKNAALLIAASAVVLGVPSVAAQLQLCSSWTAIYVTWLIALAALSALVAAFSLLPRTRIPWLLPSTPPQLPGNVLFYGEIHKLDPDTYLNSLRSKLGLLGDPIPIERDYAEQIIVNSRITMEKYTLFSIALWTLLFGVLTPLVAAPLMLIVSLGRRQ